ncbi:MAG: M3 family peptidase, partial [Catalinimonas sp.]
MDNVLLRPTYGTPHEALPFDDVRAEDFIPALREALDLARAEVKAIRDRAEAPTFGNTIEALERNGERLSLISSMLFNLNAAETTEAIQLATREASPLLTEWGNDILLDEALFARVARVWEERATYDLTPEAATLLEKTYLQFVRNGANLDDAGKQRLRELDKALAERQLTFGEHVLHAT